jgi:hypothetical protein
MIPRTKPGVQPDPAARLLVDVAAAARTAADNSGGAAWNGHMGTYLNWVQRADLQLDGIFADRTVVEELYTSRHWQIHDLSPTSIQPIQLINTEFYAQAARIQGLADSLSALARWLTAAPGTFVVLDTNVLLHYLPPDQVKWAEIVKPTPLRLTIPLRVIEELDEKKYTARDELAGRARDLLSKLRPRLVAAIEGPSPLADGTTIEVPPEQGPRHRTVDADEEVLNNCETIQAAGARLILVTGDTGMTVRAAYRGIETAPMLDKYLRRRPPAETELAGGPT